MRRWLAIPLVLLILQRVDSQNMDIGNALPCGEDNLSCINPVNSDDPNDCLTTDQLCDGTDDCAGGLDEGTEFATLDCNGAFGPPMLFRCTGGEFVQLEGLCDGFNNCTSGEDERSLICENKCRLPYYGDCDFTRECVTSEFGQNCAICLPGLTPDLTGNPTTGPCIPAVFLTLDATSYDAAEGVPTVQVCVSGSVGTGDLNDIAGESFEVDLALSDGTAIGGGVDYVWTASPAVLTLTFGSTNLLTQQCFDITINDDELVEMVEMFTVALSLRNNPRGQVMLQNSSASISIADNDVATFSLVPTTYTVEEGVGDAVVVVECTGGNLTFDIEVTFETVVLGSTATAGADYTATTVILTFGSGTTDGSTQAANIPIIEDGVVEEEEIINIRIFGLSVSTEHAVISAAAGNGTITIINIDVLCPEPVDIDNGTVSFTNLTVGSIASYTCDLGFELIGDPITTCTQVDMDNAAFEPAPPSCRPLCDNPVDIDNGTVTFNGTLIGDMATYTCDSGFELIGDANTTCTLVDMDSAEFQLAPPSCRPLCDDPVNIDNGQVTFNGNSVGDMATYTCDLGFELIGNATTTCTQVDMASAEFQPGPPSCRPLCDDPDNINNGQVTFNGNSVGDMATYTCDLGFELIGNATTTCTQVDMASAEFQPGPPSCRPLCDDPDNINNGQVTFNGNSVGDTTTYTCDLGFELIGNATTTCTQVDMDSAEFELAPPSCRPLCDDPVDIDNGTVTFNGNSVGDMATYTCDLGFELIGNTTTICTLVAMDSAEFQLAPPSCRPLCDDPVDINNGMVTFSGNSIGDMATYTCDSGFELIGNATTTCTLVDMDSAQFQMAPPSCRPLCDDPVNIDNGQVTFNGNSVGDMATYACDLGFELIGNATTTCTLVDMDSAGFQPAPPSCRPLCDDPVGIDNGTVTFNGNFIGDMATYTCDLGFELIGNATTTCALVDMGSAVFQPAPPSCRPLCDDPIDIDNGMVTFNGNSIDDIATYTCDLGFELIGNTTTTCTLVNMVRAEFQPAPPFCRPLCDDPVDIGNGTVTFYGNSIGDMATYTCDLGFVLIGNATTTCTLVDMDSAEFQPAPPSCRLLPPCEDPVDIDNGTVTFNGTLIGEMATYTCDSGFELVGDATTTCALVDMDSAEFQPAPPSCRPLCDDPVDIDNGMVTFNGNSIGDMATYTCDLGFELIGNVNTTCTFVDMDRAEFQPVPPSCTLVCDDPVDIDNGMVTSNGNSIGDIAMYTCDLGFELIGCATTTCTQVDMDSAEFQPAPPSCRPLAMCDDPVAIDNGMVTFNDTSIGDMAIYTCDAGFELIGNATTTCTLVDIVRAEFQPAPPSCRPLALCEDPVHLDNGKVTHTASYTCESGFELIGDATTTCTLVYMDSAELQPAPPSCRPLCDDPVDIDNGMVTFTGNSVGDMVTYTCDLGYELIGNVTTTCTLVDTDSAEFQPAPPSCRPLCDDLVHLANGMVTVMTTYSCDSGFELIGDATCTAGAMDSAATPPSCRPLCDDPVDIENGMVTFNGNSVGDMANYTCDSGFELIGDATTTCTLVNKDSAIFQLAPPACRCLALDCQNGATCVVSDGSFLCNCTAGYTGTLCETDIDECAENNPCQNGATCINNFGSFTCNCAAGYEGHLCNMDIDECATNNSCENGICDNTGGSFQCICDAGFTGELCSENIDDCDPNPCQHGGNCTDGVNTFTCMCAQNWIGMTCEVCDIDNCRECVGIPGVCIDCEEGHVLDQDTCVAVSTSTGAGSDDTGALIGIIIGSLLGGLLLIVLIYIIVVAIHFYRKREASSNNSPENGGSIQVNQGTQD